MKRRTKIVCTLGPAVATKDKIKSLAEAGMNIVRINCSHGDWETRRQWIGWARELSQDIAPLGILADLAGPKFRLAAFPGEDRIVTTGETVTIGGSDYPENFVPIDQKEIVEALASGDRILIGDGEIELKIISGDAGKFEAKVVCGGAIKSRKGITLMGKSFDVPSLTDKDIEDIREAASSGVDYIALSYVRDSADLRALRREVDKYDPTIRLCAKIETRSALKNIDEIMKLADLIMVARGDLGLQMDIEDVPAAQKKIIEKCGDAGKPVITATQMLESMMYAGRPTRAEATDVVNAILDGSDAVMLSGETAAGEFPIESVRTIARLAEKAESLYDRNRVESRFRDRAIANGHGHTEAVAHAAADLADRLQASAIIISTSTGETARFVSKFRPKMPILCVCWSERTRNQLAAIWGIEAITLPLSATTDESVHQAIDGFLRRKRLKVGDTVVVTAGATAGHARQTNLIVAETVR